MNNKDKKEGILKVTFRATQKTPFLTLNGFENTIKMLNTYIVNRGAMAAIAVLVIRWADVCNINPIKLINIIVEDEIMDSELSEMNDQADLPKDGKSNLPNSVYVSEFLSKKLSLLHSNPKHLANAGIYNDIFDTLNTSYLTLYNQKYAMNTMGFISKKNIIHAIGKNYHLDSVLYPSMINTMVASAYATFFKKANNNTRVRGILLDSVQDEDFSLKLVDEFTTGDYDEAIEFPYGRHQQ